MGEQQIARGEPDLGLGEAGVGQRADRHAAHPDGFHGAVGADDQRGRMPATGDPDQQPTVRFAGQGAEQQGGELGPPGRVRRVEERPVEQPHQLQRPLFDQAEGLQRLAYPAGQYGRSDALAAHVSEREQGTWPVAKTS